MIVFQLMVNQETSKDLAEFLEHFLIKKRVIYAIER